MSYPNLVAANAPEDVTIASAVPADYTPEQIIALAPSGLTEVNAAGDTTSTPLGQSGPFVVTTPSGEQILCSSITPQGFATVWTAGADNGRGYGETSPAPVIAGAPAQITATSAQDTSAGTGSISAITSDDGSVIVTDASGPSTDLSVSATATITSPEGAYPMTGTERIIVAGGAITLPDPATFAGIPYTIKDDGSGAASVLPNDAETIDSQASITLSTPYGGATVSSDGTNWWIVAIVDQGSGNISDITSDDSTIVVTDATGPTTDLSAAAAIATALAAYVPAAQGVAVAGGAVSVPAAARYTTITNDAAASAAITMDTAGAYAGLGYIVQFYDFSDVAQDLSWVNTEDSTVSVPTTSNGSTTEPITIGFIFNATTGNFRCVAVA
jgi:hypothetical protein